MQKVTAGILPKLKRDKQGLHDDISRAAAALSGEIKLLALPSWRGNEGHPDGLVEQLALVAEKHRTYFAFHAYVREGKQLYSRCWLVDDRGQVCFRQDQTHDRSGTLTIGDSLHICRTSLGTVGFLLGDDVRVPEVGRILRLQGANLFLAYSFLPAPANPWRQWAGVWQQVQQNQVFALEASFNGQIDGHDYAGDNVIHAPCEMTVGDSGFLARGSAGACLPT